MTIVTTIADVPPRIQYTGIGTESTYTYPFPIFLSTDLKVFQGSTLLTEISDYTVAGAGDPAGGSITLTTALGSGVVLTIIRDRRIEQTNETEETGSSWAALLNSEFDDITASLQEVAEEAKRGIKLKEFDETTTLELPVKADRADKVLTFDSNGNIATVSSLTNITIDADNNTLLNIGAAECVIATQAEAEAGTNTTKLMTPERVKQAIGELSGGSYLITGGNSINVSNTTSYFGARMGDPTESNTQLPLPPGTLKDFRIWVTNAPGAGESNTATVRLNGVSTSITCAASGSNTKATDLVNTASVSDQDLFSIELTGSSGAAPTGSFGYSLIMDPS